jgi:4,5-DOPA dioxygenase extradiol
MGNALPRPEAILAVSAHWYTSGAALTVNSAPATIHDFGGFPPELYAVQYPAPGSPQLAQRVQKLLAPLSVDLTEQWGLDHGTWSVLRHVYPHADVPVVQLSIDGTKPAAFHFDVGRRLEALREENVLIVGSGNLVHNLRAYHWGDPAAKPFDWAVQFEARVRDLLEARDYSPLQRYETLGREALLAIPTPEHYLPLLYVLGASGASESLQFPVQGMDGGSVSMLAVQIG